MRFASSTSEDFASMIVAEDAWALRRGISREARAARPGVKRPVWEGCRKCRISCRGPKPGGWGHPYSASDYLWK